MVLIGVVYRPVASHSCTLSMWMLLHPGTVLVYICAFVILNILAAFKAGSFQVLYAFRKQIDMNLEAITFYDCVAFIKGLCFAFFWFYKITVRSCRKKIGATVETNTTVIKNCLYVFVMTIDIFTYNFLNRAVTCHGSILSSIL